MTIIERLMRFYRQWKPADYEGMSIIWQAVSHAYHTKLIKVLSEGTEEEVKAELDSIGTYWAVAGIEEPAVYKWNDERGRLLVERLAQCAGVLPLRNPENQAPHLTENWKAKDVMAVKAIIEKVLGFQLSVPDYLGFKCSGDDGGVPHRFLHYCAAVANLERRPNRILEIGAGFANLGLIAYRWRASHYTVIDLPMVAVIGAYCLSHVVPPEQIWLCGEEEFDAFAKFYPSTNFEGARSSKYDLVFNSDSFPEILPHVQQTYLNLISDTLDWDGKFLSINHESDTYGQVSVPLAVTANGRLKLVSRHPFGMREGYAEEVYRLGIVNP